MINSISNSSPLISVAMATYNGERFLHEQLESILNQNYPNIEIVIVDDCSRDKTWEILHFFQNRCNKITIYKNTKNIGVVKTFERAMSLTQGDFIALSDQDDVWLPHKLTTLFNEIEDNWLIHSDAVLVNSSKEIISNSFSRSMKKIDRYSLPNILVGNTVTGCTTLINRKILTRATPFPNFHIHDHYLAIIAAKFNKLTYCDKPLVLYRQHENNTLGTSIRTYNEWYLDIKKINLIMLKTVNCLKGNYDLDCAIEYFTCLTCYKFPSLKLHKWVISNFGIARYIGYLFKGSFGYKIAKIFYNFRIWHIIKSKNG